MRLPAIVVPLVLAACGGGNPGLKLTRLNASAQRPSNVAVYFTVDTADGDPVAGLEAKSFRISEDGQPVSVLESKQMILNPEIAAAHHTLLLIDMSGSVSESDDVPLIIEAARGFAARVEKYQKVAVYAFDGSKQMTPLVGFTTGAPLQAGVEMIGEFRTRDPSTNLHGAIVEGVKVLERQKRTASQPLSFGTLVVFTDGTDRAGRVTAEEVKRTLDGTEIDVFVIGVGAELDDGSLRAIGRDGAVISKDRGKIQEAFEQTAARIEAFSKRYYLLGYCSPARDGTHRLTIQTEVDGKSGELSYEFNARGFGPECDPERKPAFNTTRPPPPPREPGPDAGEGRIEGKGKVDVDVGGRL